MPSRDDIVRQAETRLGALLKNKWRLESLLGIGGMAAVYRGVHRNGKRVAIKVLHQHLTADSTVRSRFLREGYIANAVGHPAVVGVDDDEVDGDAAFLVAELVDGETLEQRRKQAGKLTGAFVLPAIAELLDVLVIAHDAGIVHRDIKPENLMVMHGGGLRVLDFGLARARDVLAHEADLTGPGALLGTPHFAAPEQAAGRWNLVDARTDLWAVGATMFRLLTGRYVHEGAISQEVLTRAATEPAVSLGTQLPDAPASLVELVDRALAFAKADRFPDARSMLAAFDAVASELDIVLPERQAPSDEAAPNDDAAHTEIDAPDSAVGSRAPVQRELSSAPPSSRARSWLPALVLSAAIAIAVIGVQVRDQESDEPTASNAPAAVAPAKPAAPAPPLRSKKAQPSPSATATPAQRPVGKARTATPDVSASATAAPSAVGPNPLDRRK